MGRYYSPKGNIEVWRDKPEGYYTVEEWQKIHPAPEPPEPSKDEKLAQLDSDNQSQKQELINQYTDDMLHGDTDAMDADREAMTELDAWYDEEYAKIEGSAE
jgi:alkylated DNA repair dioxygenase AlkB